LRQRTNYLNNLRSLRKERDISIVQLARHAEVTEGFVAMVERAERLPSKAVAKKFAEILNLPLEIIFTQFNLNAEESPTSRSVASRWGDSSARS